jgi:iron complex transport system substrate-binding protein
VSLDLIGLSVDIGGRRIVSDVDITVPTAASSACSAPTAAGSRPSSRPSTGSTARSPARCSSTEPTCWPCAQGRRPPVAVVAQESTVEFDFTVFEMVMIGRTPHKRAFDRDDEADRAIVAEAIERVGCEHLAHRSFNTLSGGEKQRVLIARAIAQGADHLILDEPTNHLDIRYQIEILELVAGLGSRSWPPCTTSAWPPCSATPSISWPTALDRRRRPPEGGDHHRDGAPRLRRRRPGRRAPRDRDAPPHPPGDPAREGRTPLTAGPSSEPAHQIQSVPPKEPVPSLRPLRPRLYGAPGVALDRSPPASPAAALVDLSAGRRLRRAATANYPVTVSNCGTYRSPTPRPRPGPCPTTSTPPRTCWPSASSRTWWATSASTGDGPVGKPVPPSIWPPSRGQGRLERLLHLEKLVGLHPDFLFAGWNYGLQVGTNLTPTNLAKFGIKTLVLTESCAHVQSSKQSVSIDDTYQDLTNLGEIFGVEQRAQQVIASMKAQVASVQAKVAGLAPVTVFDYDSGTSAPFTGPGLAMPNALITLGGAPTSSPASSRAGRRCRGSRSWRPTRSASSSTTTARRPPRAKGEVPGDQPDHQEPDRGQEPLLPAPQLRRGHAEPPQREAVVKIARWLHPGVRSARRRVVRAIDPDLILAQDLCRVCAVPSGAVEEALGVIGCQSEVLSLDPGRLDEVIECIGIVGAATGTQARADALMADLRARVDAVRRRVHGRRRPRVLVLEWPDPPFNAGHWVPDQVEAAGGEPVLAAGGDRSRRLSWEEIVGESVDITVFMPCGFDLEGAVEQAESFLHRSEAADLGQIYAVDANAYFSRPGPRVVDGVEILGQLLHPERPGEVHSWGVCQLRAVPGTGLVA